MYNSPTRTGGAVGRGYLGNVGTVGLASTCSRSGEGTNVLTRIAAGWKQSCDRHATVILLAGGVITVDILLCYLVNVNLLHHYISFDTAMTIGGYQPQVRAICSLILLAVYVVPRRLSMSSLGLHLSTEQGVWWWARATVLIGSAIGVFAVIGLAGMKLDGCDVYKLLTPMPSDRLLHSWFWAPLTEEITYRLTLCTLVTAAIGPRTAIIISGVAFAALHFVYGNPAPTNIIAGFFFAWAFLRSGSFLVPVLLHSLGNLLVYVVQVAAWYSLR